MINTNYFPEFGGSTGGWLDAAETEEKYVVTWTNDLKKSDPKDNIFEMPTGGAAIMKKGPNLVYFARKEQGLALGKQLRTNFKINDYRIFRLFPSGEIQFIHPKDGVFPEKVNEGRIAVGKREFSIGKNPNPASIKFTGTTTYNTYPNAIGFRKQTSCIQCKYTYRQIITQYFVGNQLVLKAKTRRESNFSRVGVC